MPIIGILVAVLVVCIVLWATRALLSAFSIPDPISTVIFVIVVLIVLMFLLGQLGIVPFNVRLVR